MACTCYVKEDKTKDNCPVTVEVQMPFTTPIALPLRFEIETQTKTETVIFPIVVPPKNQ